MSFILKLKLIYCIEIIFVQHSQRDMWCLDVMHMHGFVYMLLSHSRSKLIHASVPVYVASVFYFHL